MYELYFNLRVKPFELLPDPNFIYLAKSHKKALTYLNYGIREKAGFILLTGDVGSGKTTLIRNLLEKHNENLILAKVFNTSVNSEQLLAMVNDDFGIPVSGKDKIALLRDLNDFLIRQFAAGHQPVLIIDEAQNLSSELLEEIRMLSNLETSSSKLLQIIMVGQPELREILASQELLQLRQRISINCHLAPLTPEETKKYILHRLEVAGNAEAVEFEEEAAALIYRYSHGIPRLINIICDFLMLAAYAEETRIISCELARDVIGDLDFENHFWSVTPAINLEPVPQAMTAGAAPTNMDTGIKPMISEILNRIDAIEKDISVASVRQPAPSTDEHMKKLESLIKGHLDRTDCRLNELARHLGEMKQRIERNLTASGHNDPAKTGIIRRMLGYNLLNK